MTRKILLMILFLYSSLAIGSNVHVYADGKLTKTHVWAVIVCGKIEMYVFNDNNKTKIVSVRNISKRNIRKILKRAKKLRKVRNITMLDYMSVSCDRAEYISI